MEILKYILSLVVFTAAWAFFTEMFKKVLEFVLSELRKKMTSMQYKVFAWSVVLLFVGLLIYNLIK